MGKHGHTPKRLVMLAPGISLRQLSKRTGIDMPHLSRIVNGKRNLTIDTTRRISEALTLSMDDVVRVLDVNQHKRRGPSERAKRGQRCAAKGCNVRHNAANYETRLHAHHPDENDPKRVVHLCPAHHKAAHGGSFTNPAIDAA